MAGNTNTDHYDEIYKFSTYNHPLGLVCYIEIHLRISNTNTAPYDRMTNYFFTELYIGDDPYAKIPPIVDSDLNLVLHDYDTDGAFHVYHEYTRQVTSRFDISN